MDYSAYLVPLLLAFTALFGLWKRVNVYDALSLGAREGLDILLALPRPSRLADTLPDSAARVSGSRHARGRRRPSRGRNRRLRPSMSPLAFMMACGSG